MAAFYQEPNPTNDPNYLGSSKEPDRIQADQSMGALFENIGGIANKAFPAVENLFKEHIKDSANQLIDPIMAEHGTGMGLEDVKGIAGTGAKGRVRALQMQNGAPTYDDTGAEAGTEPLAYGPSDAKRDQSILNIFPVNDTKPLPQNAQREISALQRYNQAYANGSLSDSAYNAQLLAVTTKLRAQYPGFRDEVDQAVSSITGIQPANALRASLQRDIQYNQAAALASQSTDQKFRDKYRAEASAVGLNPDTTPIETLRPAVNEYVGTREILKAQQLRAEVGSPQAEAALSDTIARTVQQAIVRQGNTTQGGMSISEFDKQAQELTVRGANPKEQDALVNQMTIARAQLEQQIRETVYKPLEGDPNGHSLVSKTKDGDKKLAGILEAQLKPYDDRIALAKAGNFSALERVTNMNKYQTQADMSRLTAAFPQARQAAAINNAFPNNPLMVNQFMERTSILGDFGNAIKTGLGNAIIGATDSNPAPKPSDAVGFYPKDVPQGAAYKATARQYDLIISADNKNIPNAAHVAKQFFSDQKFYDDLNEAGRMKLFMTFANPDKQKFIQSIAQGDPSVLQAHQNWIKYAASDIFRRNSDDLNSLLSRKDVDISFNPSTMQFEDRTPKNTQTYATVARQTNDTIQSINNAITLVKPMVGGDPGAVLSALGVDPSPNKEDGIVTRMFNALGDKLKNWRSDMQNEGVIEGSRAAKPGKQSMNDQPGGALRQVVGQAESGGDYNNVFGMGKDSSRDLSQLTVGEVMALQKHHTDSGSPSSAAGKYQFLRGTLASLVKEGHARIDERFTPDLQEELFTKLAQRRGLNDFLSGKMDEDTFHNNLSKEWAGLPTTNGMSFYSGDGLNKATTTPEKVRAALRKLKAEG